MFSIRPATIEDAPLIAALIHEFAEFEHLENETSVIEEDIARDGFGPKPKFRAVIAEWDGHAAGYAIFFEFYSSFQGRGGLFLDDLYVRPQFRQQGIGKALLAHVAALAWRESYFCLRWEVLDWNATAIDFYRSLGASFMDEWKSAVLIGDALESVANVGKATQK
ncbi:MAG TPA: GNAT family N-acetyltransferase [Candidatus Dormibacteraeota bacterium]|nr:GNAT family N-acetyltransferase [Candidatus Dormibacteraeota bacterium]